MGGPYLPRNPKRRLTIQGDWTISSPGLPAVVLRIIYFDNARKLLGRSLPLPVVTARHISDERLTFDLEDDRSVSVPLAFYPTLMLATPEERADFDICHASVYWPKLDCDLSSDCLLRGAREARKFAAAAWRRRAGVVTA